MALAAAALAAAFGLGTLAGAPVAWPFDVVVNLAPAIAEPTLRAPEDGAVRVVVLQHGLFRTAASLGRLERTLRAHGYEVLNPGYASTRGSIAAHAEGLARAIAARRAQGRVDAFAFVGHSLGGLVIAEYLRRADAVTPWAVVTLGTPHRGAVLADLRKHWFLFRWAMGHEAACELSPGDPLHRRPWPHAAVLGALAGRQDGDGNAAIPGADDGTVAVAEALPDVAAARGVVPVGHTRLSFAAPALQAVLHFLARGTFPAAVAGG